METKRHWYFITDQYFGEETKLLPRRITHQGESEPLIKRICVAPTAKHCFSAIGTCPGIRMFVYQTKRKVIGIKAWDVPDQRMTKEHWRLKPTDFVLTAILNVPDKAQWPWGSRGDGPLVEHAWKQQNRDKRQIGKWLERLGDPRLYKIDDANQSWRIRSDLLEKKED